MTTSGPTQTPPNPSRTPTLRRSRDNRMLSGVAGGLGEYFAVDPVIFRVLFAVLSFFGGVGILLYLACWLLLPEQDVQTSALDRFITTLRINRVPAWVVVLGAAVVLWLGWFSWWAPHTTLAAFILVAALILVLLNRVSDHRRWPTSTQSHTNLGYPEGGYAAPAAQPWPTEQNEPWQTPPAAATQPWPTEQNEPWQAEQNETAAEPWETPTQSAPLIPPLSDTRRSINAWYTESRAAQRARQERRRPLAIAVAVIFFVGLAVIGLADAVFGVSFAAYLWFAVAVFGIGWLVSVLTRRTLWVLLPLALFMTPLLVVFGNTSASLSDGSGQYGWVPTSQSQLTDHKQFAGNSVLDLTKLPALTTPETISISQGAGRVKVIVPPTANVTVTSAVHAGDTQLNHSHDSGEYAAGFNTSLTINPPASVTEANGEPLTVDVTLTAGHVQIVRQG